MDLTLNDELKALRENAARFAKDQIEPYAQQWESAGGYPDAMIRKLGDQGFMGIIVPEQYGGSGGDHMAFAVILEELARYDGGLALAVEAHNGLCCAHILNGGNEAQKKRFLPPLAAGDQIGCWCLTEPGSGTDAAAMSTRAVRDGDHWVLNGSKQFITNGDRAGTFVVMAITDPSKGNRGIGSFIIERGTPGLSTGPREHKLGMRSSDTVTVTLDNVRVPADQCMASEGAFDTVKKVLERGRIMISALSLGLARGGLEESAKYAYQRKTFGKPIGEYQAIQHKLADMATQIEAARLMIYQAATLQDQGHSTPLEAATTKVFCSEMATRICMEAIQIHGGYGYLKEYNVERYMRDAKLCEIGEGTSEILRVLIARATLKRLGIDTSGGGRG
jgi:alkylation response protein AidB-like acyl-CoA dehydrogenase